MASSTKKNADDTIAQAWSMITKDGSIKQALDETFAPIKLLLRHLDAPAGIFMCDDSKTIPLHFVNDDYCDCVDGADEPFTSACSGGITYKEERKEMYFFSCKLSSTATASLRGAGAAVGSISVPLPPSRVNDGVCDW